MQPGERVLDVGVGSGPTTGQAWEAVRPDGSVTGIDIAAPMINAARQRVAAPEIEWIVGDAAAYDFPPKEDSASRDVDRQKDALLDEISRRLEQKTTCEPLFSLRRRVK